MHATAALVAPTLPNFDADDQRRVLAVMRERGWTEADIAARVTPHLSVEGLRGAALVCPKRHLATSALTGEQSITCPQCDRTFDAVVGVNRPARAVTGGD